MKKHIFYGLCLLVALFSAVTEAMQISQRPGVRPWVTNFVNEQMNGLFTGHERSFTERYDVQSRDGDVLIRRVPSKTSSSSAQASSRFSQAVNEVIEAILALYDAHGFAERIDVSATNRSNIFAFTPVFLIFDESDESGDDDEDEDNIGGRERGYRSHTVQA
ncbi:MAG: hypothetical protein M1549_03460 [Candidatus Dependentiae bacterium]|nr:hypothetical protein [Candidatus Dependentiae bacterium]